MRITRITRTAQWISLFVACAFTVFVACLMSSQGLSQRDERIAELEHQLEQQLAKEKSEKGEGDLIIMSFNPGTYALLRVDPVDDRDLYFNDRVCRGHFTVDRLTFISGRELANLLSQGRMEHKDYKKN